jgi:hypothetical protein
MASLRATECRARALVAAATSALAIACTTDDAETESPPGASGGNTSASTTGAAPSTGSQGNPSQSSGAQGGASTGAGGSGGGAPNATGCLGAPGMQVGPVKVSDEGPAYYPKVFKASEATLAVAWKQVNQGTLMRLVDRQTLQPLPEEPIMIAGEYDAASQVRFAAWPSGLGLSYKGTHWSDGSTTCYARMFAPDLTLLGQGIADTADGACRSPSMVHDGTGWAYFWIVGNGGIGLRFLDDTGGWLSTAGVDDTDGSGLVSGFNPLTQRYVAIYEKAFPMVEGSEIASAEVDLTGMVHATGTRISDGDLTSRFPEMAWNGSGFGAIWDDERNQNGYYELYFSALDGHGAPIGADIPLVTSADGYVSGGRIASNGQVYAVVWRSAADEIRFEAVDLAGNPIGSEHILALDVAEHAAGPDVTWDGERFVVVWFENTQGVQTEQIFAAAVCP